MEGAWGRRLLRGVAQMSMVVAVSTAGFVMLTPAAGAQQVGTSFSGSGVRVLVYNQMCDGGFQHTRLNVRNSNGGAVRVTISDPSARSITYRPSGYIPSGTSQVVSIIAAPNAPARTATASVSPGGSISIDIPFKDCCPQNLGYASCVEVVPTTVVSVPPYVPPGAEVIPKVTTKVATAVKSGTLPFTGSDVRFISTLAALFLILGGAFMTIQFRNDSFRTLRFGEVITRRGLVGPSGANPQV